MKYTERQAINYSRNTQSIDAYWKVNKALAKYLNKNERKGLLAALLFYVIHDKGSFTDTDKEGFFPFPQKEIEKETLLNIREQRQLIVILEEYDFIETKIKKDENKMTVKHFRINNETITNTLMGIDYYE